MAEFEQEHEQEGIDTYRKMNNHKIKLIRDRVSNMRSLTGKALNTLYNKKINKTAEIKGSDSITITDDDSNVGDSGRLSKNPKVEVDESWLETFLEQSDVNQDLDDVAQNGNVTTIR